MLADGIAIVAALPREDARDALVGAAGLDELPQGARVGTSSLRRAGQLLALRPDLQILPLRGNVDTRLAKLEAGEVDAAVLAKAGLNRLGHHATGTPLDALVPAPGQGVVVLTARTGDTETAAAAAQAGDAAALTALRAERAIGVALGADCTTAIGAHARAISDDLIELRVVVTTPDGARELRDLVTGPLEAPEELARGCAARLERAGVRELL